MRILKISKVNIVLVSIIMMAILLCCSSQVQAAQEGGSTTVAPANDNQARAQISNSKTNFKVDGAPDFKMLVIQDTLPWNTNTNETVLNKLGVNYQITTTQVADTLNFSDYATIIVANDQLDSFYERYSFIKAKLESYVRNGGSLVFGACDGGWGGNGTLNDTLPGGVQKVRYYDYYNSIVDATHPIVTGTLTDGVPLTSALYHNYCSHDYFVQDTLPSGTNIILKGKDSDQPTLVEYKLGKGRVIASTLTWEHNYVYISGGFAQIAMDDYFKYAFPMFDVDFDVSSTVLDMEQGDEEIITVTPKSGYEFVSSPTFTFDNPDNVSVAHFMENGINKYCVKALKYGKTVIEFDATYNKIVEASLKAVIQNATQISSTRKVNANVNETETENITVSGQFSYIDVSNNNAVTPLKNNPIIIYNTSNHTELIIKRTMTDNNGRF